MRMFLYQMSIVNYQLLLFDCFFAYSTIVTYLLKNRFFVRFPMFESLGASYSCGDHDPVVRVPAHHHAVPAPQDGGPPRLRVGGRVRQLPSRPRHRIGTRRSALLLSYQKLNRVMNKYVD